MADALWLVLAGWLTLFGMGRFALSIDTHWRQLAASGEANTRRLRLTGGFCLALSLLCCLEADHASMAVLVWVMMLAVAAFVIAMILAWRAHWLCLLLWLRPPSP